MKPGSGKMRAGSKKGVVGILAGLIVFSVIAGGFLLFFGSGSAAASPTCNLVVNSENLADNAVQSAIDSASPGWKVCLGAGSFPEQLTISTPGLKLVGAGAAKTFIDPTSVVADTVDWDSAPTHTPAAALLFVNNTTGVTIQGLAVSGSSSAGSISGCGEEFIGVDIQNSSGTTLLNDGVTGIELPPALLGCQNQLAVYAYTGYYATSYVPASPVTVTMTHVSVTKYGKNGITCDDPALSCVLSGDSVVGIGPTSATAQNGIQIAYGAVGTLSHDLVKQNAYTGTLSTLDWYGNGYQAAGILLYLPGAGTTVETSTVSSNAMGVVSYGPAPIQIVGNSVSGSTGYGIVENGEYGTQALIANNTVNEAGAGGVGILVDNGTFNLTGNHIEHSSSSGTNGASQVVCGSGSYLACSPSQSVSTAAIQAVSESSAGPTNLVLSGNVFRSDSLSIATTSVLGGSVSLQFA